MAQLSGGTIAAIRMDQINLRELIDGDPLTQSSITQVIDKGSGVTVTWRGIAFLYGDATEEFGYVDRLIRGMVFSITQLSGDSPLLSVTGLAFMLTKQFSQDVRAPSSSVALGKLFADNDTMQGTAFGDFLNGYAGHDNLLGGDGADTLMGGTGNDHLYGQSPTGGADGNDSIAGEDGDDYLQGNAGNDTLDGGNGADRIQGGQGNDNILGGAGNDAINGNLGNDSLDGGDGNDSLRGGQGNDSLSGGVGTDTLSGDLGADNLRGGTGADQFVFTGDGAVFSGSTTDVIADFTNGSDKIDLSFTVAAVVTGDRQSSFSQALTVAQQLMNERVGDHEVAAVAVGSDTYVFFANDGSNTIDSAVRLSSFSASSVDVGDFI